MSLWIAIVLLAAMAALLAYACCSVAGKADRRDEARPVKPGKEWEDV